MKVSQGKCELCGKDNKTLRDVFGKKVCSVCETIRRAAHNTPGLLVVSVAEAKGHEWLAGLCGMTDIPPANVLDLEGEIAAKDKEISELNTMVSVLGEKNIDLLRLCKETKEVWRDKYNNDILAEKTRGEKFKEALTAEVANAKAANSDMMDKHNSIVAKTQNLIAAKDNVIESLREEISGMDSSVIKLNVQAEEIKALTAAVAAAKDVNKYMLDKHNTLLGEVADLRECNKNLEQERFYLSVHMEKLTAAATAAKNDLANAAKNVPAPFAGSIQFDLDNEAQMAIVCACEELCTMLIQKNTAYCNSALEPLRMFSKASTREQLLVRLDDKLSRLAHGGEFPGDDTIVDLAGYLVLLLAHDRLAV
jgi:hypothetical protein